MFNLYSQIFSNYYDLKSSVTDLTLNWWLLSIDIEGHTQSSTKSQLKAGSLKGFDVVYTTEIEDSVKIQAEVIASAESISLEVGQLRDLFLRISKFEKQD
jgi:CO dehydrogenase/acetyl-CoA synthase gamma subunit (corrinoid Fe-S protein)